jgi:PAS domain S-box-containing protein
MTSAKIMIVEDEPITAEDLQEALIEMGYTVNAMVSTAADAIREAERTRPDLIIMDIHIRGDIDGVDAARTIRQRFDIPAVYLTAHADAETLSRAKLAEPLGYIIKPFQEPEMQATIEMALHKQSIDRHGKQTQQRLSAALGAIGEGVITIDASGSVTLLNPAAEAWTGLSQIEALGKNIDAVFPTAPSSSGPIRRALAEGDLAGLNDSCVLISRDGAKRAIGGSVAPIRDHNHSITGAVIVSGKRKIAPPWEPLLRRALPLPRTISRWSSNPTS